MKLAINLIIAFVIGFVAGVSPFLFMYLLPGLINPSQAPIECNRWCIILTGSLIGVITSIIFGKKLAERDPSDIFFYALGIPAILIGTLSNLNTNFAKYDIEKTANQLIETTPEIEKREKFIEVPPPVLGATEPKKSSSLIISQAWAGEETKDYPVRVAMAEQYVVVIGQYATKAEAERVFRELSRKRLKTEKYIRKNLKILTIPGSNSFYLSYSSHTSERDAIKAYKLLKLNDPKLTPQIIRQR